MVAGMGLVARLRRARCKERSRRTGRAKASACSRRCPRSSIEDVKKKRRGRVLQPCTVLSISSRPTGRNSSARRVRLQPQGPADREGRGPSVTESQAAHRSADAAPASAVAGAPTSTSWRPRRKPARDVCRSPAQALTARQRTGSTAEQRSCGGVGRQPPAARARASVRSGYAVSGRGRARCAALTFSWSRHDDRQLPSCSISPASTALVSGAGRGMGLGVARGAGDARARRCWSTTSTPSGPRPAQPRTLRERGPAGARRRQADMADRAAIFALVERHRAREHRRRWTSSCTTPAFPAQGWGYAPFLESPPERVGRLAAA
jgi:hypothetical protein